ncbi:MULTISPECIES: LysM peptidoglycan-binding domain-containing protein [unclassified Bacillus (in: firmicutes)]|uniref:LysM peptidoglycan-binding domain-containing protein n=1 Tax=unclassified Bacillus (in: firmicutes) TaxID=185979 RepID=UPI00227DEC1A|nr:LysM peptidoglycan-binding domain-containing protein [Bacillus sp. S20C3]MCY8288219.1 LysM peptidoglycan-binding domain-containing protein [Bacillus sp. N13C7]MCY8637011.1 LysM peptidoglycan-binding domain-containing protein [Bacillus sp. S17B2]MCY9143300.1 LysM peptidoglycan-binding domain-containing protein [Bacillus sp. T9C1]
MKGKIPKTRNQVNKAKRTPRYMEFPVTYEVYHVESGDTLWTISKSFNIPVQQLMNLNKLSSDIIYPGQMIKIRER